MSKVTSIRPSPELQLLGDSTDVPFNKRVNVIAERYAHLINHTGLGALDTWKMYVLANIPGILTMRASMIEHLPRLILDTPNDSVTDRQKLALAKEIKKLSVLERIILIERLEHLA